MFSKCHIPQMNPPPQSSFRLSVFQVIITIHILVYRLRTALKTLHHNPRYSNGFYKLEFMPQQSYLLSGWTIKKSLTVVPSKILHHRDPYVSGTCLMHRRIDLCLGDLTSSWHNRVPCGISQWHRPPYTTGALTSRPLLFKSDISWLNSPATINIRNCERLT